MGLKTFILSLTQTSTTVTVPGRAVQSVADIDGVGAAIGTAFGSIAKPPTVAVTFDNGTVEQIPIAWDSTGYDGDTIGLYPITGTLLISANDSNPDDLEAAMDVSVDSASTNLSEWTAFDGYSNYVKYGDILDSLFAAASPYFELEVKIRNMPLTGTHRFLNKVEFNTNNRSFLWQAIDNDVQFIWYTLGTTARQRGVTWADCLADTNEHTLTLKYDGAVSTNNGLDRVKLFIDGVEITAGKSLTVNSGTIGGIFSGTAQLAFGNTVNAAGTMAADQVAWFEGEAKDLVIRDLSTTHFHGLDVGLGTQVHGTYKLHVQPIVKPSLDSSAQDIVQCSLNGLVDTGTEWYIYTLMSNPDINSDRDVVGLVTKTKDNDVHTGWSKRLSAGLPEIIYDVGAVGKFDAKQVWLRNFRKKEDNTYEAWSMGQSATDTFAMGYSTSADGISWTKQNSGDAVYSDGATGITIPLIIWDADDSLYRMLYSGNQLGANICLAESSDGLSWTKTHSELLFGEGLGWALGFQKINGLYFIWAAKRIMFFSGISNEVVLYTTTDFTTFQNRGAQITRRGGREWGLTSPGGVTPFQKPDGKWCLLITSYRNQIGKAANQGEEFTQIKVAELNRRDLPIAGRQCVHVYPDNIIEHYPLNREVNSGTNILEAISGEFATINSTPVYTADATYGNRTLGFMDFNGSQVVTRSTTLPAGFDPSSFAIKLRVEILTTGTHELFRIGDDSTNKGCVITLESGKVRVRISEDGTNWAKDWIRTVNLSKPSGMNYQDNHIYISFSLISGTLTMYNDFNSVSAANITETIDNSITAMHYTNGSRTIGNNATLEIGSVSIMSPATLQELVDLET